MLSLSLGSEGVTKHLHFRVALLLYVFLHVFYRENAQRAANQQWQLSILELSEKASGIGHHECQCVNDG